MPRIETVASNMGCTRNNLCWIGKMSPEACWSIFSKVAFFDRDKEDCERFESIGRQILEKCDGLPLAAKALGSVMRLKSSTEEWRKVLNSELWELPGVWEAQTGLASLWLSYYDLPSELRRCFSYCAIYPEDHQFKERKLITVWMAQGFLGTTSTTTNSMETYGKEFFRSLGRRCFFQEFSDDGTCKMHDVLRDFAQYLTRDECYSLEINNSEDLTEPLTLPKEVRHLRIKLGEMALFPLSISTLEKLRTFWVEPQIIGMKITIPALSNLFDKLTSLRSLFLRGCGIRYIPPSISKLIHLKQLDLSNNYELKQLPENVCDLCNLQTLDVSDNPNAKLPGSMEKLINLRHLLNKYGPCFIPKGVLRLNNLMTLEEFASSCRATETTCVLRDLKILKNLEGEVIITGLGNVGIEEAKEAHLSKMNRITGWRWIFTLEETEEKRRHHEEIIEALEPSLNVEVLDIIGYKGTIFPSWLMSLNNMRKLDLECKYCEYLPPLWKLPVLEDLLLDDMRGIKRLGGGFVAMESDGEVSSSWSLVAFPKLKSLVFRSMENWEEWESVKMDEVSIMPKLCKLGVYDCRRLRELPKYIYQSETLQEVRVTYSPIIEKLYKEEQNNGQRRWANPNLIVRY